MFLPLYHQVPSRTRGILWAYNRPCKSLSQIIVVRVKLNEPHQQVPPDPDAACDWGGGGPQTDRRHTRHLVTIKRRAPARPPANGSARQERDNTQFFMLDDRKTKTGVLAMGDFSGELAVQHTDHTHNGPAEPLGRKLDTVHYRQTSRTTAVRISASYAYIILAHYSVQLDNVELKGIHRAEPQVYADCLLDSLQACGKHLNPCHGQRSREHARVAEAYDGR